MKVIAIHTYQIENYDFPITSPSRFGNLKHAVSCCCVVGVILLYSGRFFFNTGPRMKE